jgi:hypothetical protein
MIKFKKKRKQIFKLQCHPCIVTFFFFPCLHPCSQYLVLGGMYVQSVLTHFWFLWNFSQTLVHHSFVSYLKKIFSSVSKHSMWRVYMRMIGINSAQFTHLNLLSSFVIFVNNTHQLWHRWDQTGIWKVAAEKEN